MTQPPHSNNEPMVNTESGALSDAQFDVTNMIVRASSPNAMLDAFLKFTLLTVISAEIAVFKALEPHEDSLITVIAAQGLALSAGKLNTQIPANQYPAYRTFLQNQMVYEQALKEDATTLTFQEREALTERNAESLLILPLHSGDQLMGILYVEYSRQAHFPLRKLRSMQTLASQISLVLTNRQLFEDAEESAVRLNRQRRNLQLLNRIATGIGRFENEQAMFDFALEIMVQALNTDHAGLVMLQDDNTLGLVASEYPNTGTVGTILSMTNNPLFDIFIENPDNPTVFNDVLNDERVPADTRAVFSTMGIYSLMMVPLVLEGKLIGSIGLDLFSSEKIYTDEDLEIAKTISAQLATNLRLMRLLAEARHRVLQMEQLASLSVSIQSTLDTETILHQFVDNLKNIFTLDYIQIALYNAKADQLQTNVTVHDGETYIKLETARATALENSTIGDIWQKQRMVFLPDVSTLQGRKIDVRAVGAVLGAPITVRDFRLGAMVISSLKPNAYAETDIPIFQQMIAQFAIVLQNSEAYMETQSQATRERKTSEMARRLLSTTDVDLLMQLAAEEFKDALGAIYTRVSIEPDLIEAAPIRTNEDNQ